VTSTSPLWRAYLRTLADSAQAEARWYESFQIGNTVEGGNLGARLILQGVKKATSSLLWEYVAQDKPLPQNGSLSIVQNGHGEAVCVVESTWVAIRPFNEVDAEFARDYGEGDGTLAGWRKLCWDFYEAQCQENGWLASETMPLVCERFKVVYSAS
jgi:uncharacterized protein YhfF